MNALSARELGYRLCVWFDLSYRLVFAGACSKLCVLEAVREARELGYRLCVWFDLSHHLVFAGACSLNSVAELSS